MFPIKTRKRLSEPQHREGSPNLTDLKVNSYENDLKRADKVPVATEVFMPRCGARLHGSSCEPRELTCAGPQIHRSEGAIRLDRGRQEGLQFTLERAVSPEREFRFLAVPKYAGTILFGIPCVISKDGARLKRPGKLNITSGERRLQGERL